MELILTKKQASEFMKGIEILNKKFSNKYIEGEIETVVNLSVDDKGLPILVFLKPVPEMVRIACTMLFVDTILRR